jgi:hypothetical protein
MEKSLEKNLETAEALQKNLAKDLPIEELEKFEKAYKDALKNIFSEKISGEVARRLALIQKNIGFIFKYKSYTIKASNPLGYSIFFHNQGEGFSFQQHTSHKMEIFHILDVLPGGYVFVCTYDDWKKIYDEELFSEWLSGKPNVRYDQFKYKPSAGDVVILDKLGIVHTVVGCVLEEFATASTDMVERLYDQNKGKKIPNNFVRSYSENKVKSIFTPASSRLVKLISNKREIKDIKPTEINGGLKIELANIGLVANRYVIKKNGHTDFQNSGKYAISLTVTNGKGTVFIGDQNENLKDISGISLQLGDNITVSPGMNYSFLNNGKTNLNISEHKIYPEIGLV